MHDTQMQCCFSIEITRCHICTFTVLRFTQFDSLHYLYQSTVCTLRGCRIYMHTVTVFYRFYPITSFSWWVWMIFCDKFKWSHCMCTFCSEFGWSFRHVYKMSPNFLNILNWKSLKPLRNVDTQKVKLCCNNDDSLCCSKELSFESKRQLSEDASILNLVELKLRWCDHFQWLREEESVHWHCQHERAVFWLQWCSPCPASLSLSGSCPVGSIDGLDSLRVWSVSGTCKYELIKTCWDNSEYLSWMYN